MQNRKEHNSIILDSEKDAFSGRLREIIGGASTRSFANKLGFAEATVRKLLNGGLPRLDNLILIANITGVTVEWLATGRGRKTYAESEQSSTASKMVTEQENNEYFKIDLNKSHDILEAMRTTKLHNYSELSTTKHFIGYYNAYINAGNESSLKDLLTLQKINDLEEQIRHNKRMISDYSGSNEIEKVMQEGIDSHEDIIKNLKETLGVKYEFKNKSQFDF